MCMGFSLTPRSEALSSLASAARGPASPMMTLLRRRSTLSPPILKSILTSTGFSRLRDNKRHQSQSRPMDATGPTIEDKCAPDVLGTRLLARADPGVVDLYSGIGARAAEPQVEGTGERRLGPAGIGGRMSACVA